MGTIEQTNIPIIWPQKEKRLKIGQGVYLKNHTQPYFYQSLGLSILCQGGVS